VAGAGLGVGVGTAVGGACVGRGTCGRVSGVGNAGVAGRLAAGVGWPRMMETGAHGASAISAARSRPMNKNGFDSISVSHKRCVPVVDSSR